MNERNKLVIGTRGSKLALLQTNLVADALRAEHSGLELEVRTIQTKGDVDQAPIPLDTIGKNWFTAEIEQALSRKEIDLAVHSLKDVAPEIPDGLLVMPVLEREDPREALVSKTGAKLSALRQGAIVGTDSLRRKAELLHVRPDLQVKSVRGNVDTRLRKLREEDYDAIVLAVAGLKRLGMADVITELFDVETFIPAPGQGVLAAQIRGDDARLLAMLAGIQDGPTKLAVEAEQAFTREIGGGCKLPVAALASVGGNELVIRGMMGEADGSRVEYRSARGPNSAAVALAEKLARELAELFEAHA